MSEKLSQNFQESPDFLKPVDSNVSIENESLEQSVQTFSLNLEIEDLEKMDKVYELNQKKMNEGNSGEIYLKKNDFALKLKEKMGEETVYECALYYILVDGGISPTAQEKINFLDFDGDDSIEKFIENL